jgi:hypothetical protein
MTRAVTPVSKNPPTHRKPNSPGRVHSIGDATCGAFHGGIPVTDNRWELAVVTLVAIAAFFLVWHLVAPPDRLARIDDAATPCGPVAGRMVDRK